MNSVLVGQADGFAEMGVIRGPLHIEDAPHFVHLPALLLGADLNLDRALHQCEWNRSFVGSFLSNVYCRHVADVWLCGQRVNILGLGLRTLTDNHYRFLDLLAANLTRDG